jgi:hypothetical protein
MIFLYRLAFSSETLTTLLKMRLNRFTRVHRSIAKYNTIAVNIAVRILTSLYRTQTASHLHLIDVEKHSK